MADVIVLAGVAIFSFLINVLSTPLIIRISHKWKWYDLPNGRKIHTNPIPRLGGIGIFISFLVSSLAALLFMTIAGLGTPPVRFDIRHLSVFAAFSLIFFIGLVDDFRTLKAALKFPLQLVAAVLVTINGFTFANITIPFIGSLSLGVFAYPFTIFWIVSITNAMNFVDGVDGFAGGTAGFAAFFLGMIALIQGRPESALIAFAILGSVAGFLVFNFPPARIFMGDSGSLLLGFTLAVIPLLDTTRTRPVGDLLIPLTLLTIPALDITAAVVRRIRQGRAIYIPDKDHIQHKILALGLKERTNLGMVYCYCAYLGIACIFMALLGRGASLVIGVGVWVGNLALYSALKVAGARKKAQGAAEGTEAAQ